MTCTYLTDDGICGRRVVAIYRRRRAARHAAALCRYHHTLAAQRYAETHGLVWALT